MDLSKSKFARFIKKLELVIEGIEDDSSEDTDILILKLKEPIKRVESSIPLPNGKNIVLENVTTLKVASEDIQEFEKGFDEDKGIYSGTLKLDVAKPRTAQRDGQTVVVKAPQAWLVSVYYNRRGDSLRRSTRNESAKLITNLFGGGEAAPAPADNKAVAMAGGEDGN